MNFIIWFNVIRKSNNPNCEGIAKFHILGDSKMNEEHQGKIALIILKKNMRREGIHLGFMKKKDWRKKAQSLGISPKEVMEFSEILVRELVDEMYQPKKGKNKKKK